MCFCLRIRVVLDSQSRGALSKVRCSVKILPFCVGYWRDLNYNWRVNSKHPGKLGILVRIYIFSWDNKMVFLCGICLLPEKMTLLFSILNKYVSTVIWYLEIFCRMIEYPAKCTSFDFIYCTRIADSLENEPVLISGKIIWGKTVSCENNLFVQNRSTNVQIMETWHKRTPFLQIIT